MKGRTPFFLLSLSSALMLSLAWYFHLGIVIFFAFVPLLFLEERIRSLNDPAVRLKLLGYSYICFFTWNILVTWWVVYASFGGACMAFIFNSLLMSIVFVIYSNIKTRIARPAAIWFLIPVWIAWEHAHTLWDISWTWLTLGNVFAFHHNWVQWYEITGTSGGTFWILLVNILVFKAIKSTPLRFFSLPVLRMAGAIIIPILISYLILYLRIQKKPDPALETPVVVVQPNIDPYNEKFYTAYETQFLKMLNLVRGHITPETQYLVLPETFITGIDDDLNEETLSQYLEIKWFRDSLLSKFPNLKIVTGGNTYRFYHKESEISVTARKDERTGFYYDVFNSALYLDGLFTQVYHKSKLVPGVERMPFPGLLKPLEGMAINMGGTVGSLGTQEERSVFKSTNTEAVVAPVICYESIYADYVAHYVRNGANLIFIITNDGWWDDTPGYIQHLNYARLRAIEDRREIARSANTGISCFIDQYGNLSDATSWWKEAVIKKTIYMNKELTFFARFGDLLSYASVPISIVLLWWSIFLAYRRISSKPLLETVPEKKP